MGFVVTYNQNKFDVNSSENKITVATTQNKYNVTSLTDAEFWDLVDAIMTESDLGIVTETNRAVVLIQE